MRYRQELDKYDKESNRFIRSKNFEDAIVVGIDEYVTNPIYVDFGEIYGNNRYDSVSLSQIFYYLGIPLSVSVSAVSAFYLFI